MLSVHDVESLKLFDGDRCFEGSFSRRLQFRYLLAIQGDILCDLFALRVKAAGTHVTVTLVAEATTAASEPKVTKPTRVSFEYLSQSTLPVMFHVGFTYSDADDVEFQAVRGLNDRDLFVKVRDNDGVEGLTAFMSYDR